MWQPFDSLIFLYGGALTEVPTGAFLIADPERMSLLGQYWTTRGRGGCSSSPRNYGKNCASERMMSKEPGYGVDDFVAEEALTFNGPQQNSTSRRHIIDS